MVFLSGDHGPPHFHAERAGEWRAKVYFLEPAVQMLELIGPPGATIKGADRNAIIKGVEKHRNVLLEEWEQSQGLA